MFTTRSRRVRLTLQANGEVVVTAPRCVSKTVIDEFVRDHADWIIDKQNKLEKALAGTTMLRSSKMDYRERKAVALRFVEGRLKVLNQAYGFEYKKVSIRNQKSRWGSCSRAKTLSFNYKIEVLPPELADYLMVHELCHLAEMNHSKKFWALVARTMPNHKRLRAELLKNRIVFR